MADSHTDYSEKNCNSDQNGNLGLLEGPLPFVNDLEGDRVPDSLPYYDNLWLDTTMTLAQYLPMDYFPKLAEMRMDRIIFGTDFPNLPYAWDREIKQLVQQNLPQNALAKILGQNALEFYNISCVGN